MSFGASGAVQMLYASVEQVLHVRAPATHLECTRIWPFLPDEDEEDWLVYGPPDVTLPGKRWTSDLAAVERIAVHPVPDQLASNIKIVEGRPATNDDTGTEKSSCQ